MNSFSDESRPATRRHVRIGACHNSGASRRPWATPQVILGTMEGAELNVGFGSDGGTPFNDAS